MGLSFWHLLLTRDLPASITIILHQHTPLIIIGVADVAFNSCLRLHMPRYELRALDFVYMHHIILLYRTNPSSRTLAYNLPSAFSDSFNSSTSHVIFPRTIPKKHPFFLSLLSGLALVYHTPLGLISVYNPARATMMQLSYELSAPANAGGPGSEMPVNRVW
jgi:hypothetical protein